MYVSFRIGDNRNLSFRIEDCGSNVLSCSFTGGFILHNQVVLLSEHRNICVLLDLVFQVFLLHL